MDGPRCRSVFTASLCDSLGLMPLSSPDSGIFLMKWDSLVLSFVSFWSFSFATCHSHKCVSQTPSFFVPFSQVSDHRCTFHPRHWNKRRWLYKNTIISHLGLFFLKMCPILLPIQLCIFVPKGDIQYTLCKYLVYF